MNQLDHLSFLAAQRADLLRFAEKAARRDGFGWLGSDGVLDTSRPVELWITCRMTHVASLGVLASEAPVPGGPDHTRLVAMAEHGVNALRGPLRDHANGGWFAAVQNGEPTDTTKQAYGHAFVVLAASSATAAGVDGAEALLDEALSISRERFWDEDEGLSLEQWNADWTTLDTYRGVNANMHTVEAYLAAGDITREQVWHARAGRIASRVVAWARANDWRIPEHFDTEWEPQLDFNVDEPAHPFRPYGATIGHGLEWARLLLAVDEALGDQAPSGLVDAAVALYARAVQDGWSADGSEGFVYTTDWAGEPVVHERMHWVVAEAVNAAEALARVTGDRGYLDDAARWWQHARDYLIDGSWGSWHHELDTNNQVSATVWPGKPDVYHAYQAALLPELSSLTSFSGGLLQRGGLSTGEVLSIGECVLDVVVMPDGMTTAHAGGSPANVAVGLARLGQTARVLTELGEDEAGRVVREHLESSGVAVDVRAAERTPVARASIDADGAATYEFDILWELAAGVDALGECTHVHTGSIAAHLEPGASTVVALIRHARAQATVSYDPNVREGIVGSHSEVVDLTETLVALADVVKASDEDLKWLYPDDDPATVLRRWHESGPAVVVATLGSEGSLVMRAGELTRVAPIKVDVVDTVGAGDSYMAALIDGLARAGLTGPSGRERLSVAPPSAIDEIVQRAARAAAITVSRAGANPPNLGELGAG